jgi:protoporphyrinogen oxidase
MRRKSGRGYWHRVYASINAGTCGVHRPCALPCRARRYAGTGLREDLRLCAGRRQLDIVPVSFARHDHVVYEGTNQGNPMLNEGASRPSEQLIAHHVVDGHAHRPDGERRVVILGAGPAGLTAAYELMRHQVPSLTLEKDPRCVGGISRTEEHHGYRFDIGGHRFFSKSQEVEDFWTEILGDEMLTRARLSRIFYRGKYFDYPLKAGNAFLNMGPIETVRCILSYVWARVRPNRNPKSLEEWVTNQFGHRLFTIFFKTYTEKVWGISTKELSADWAAQRIKGLNLTQAIRSALLPRRAGGTTGDDRSAVIKTLIDEFRYPKYGPGQMWERVAQRLREGGNIVALGQEVVAVRHDGGRVTSAAIRDRVTGQVREVTGSHFISTLPIRELIHILEPAPPSEVVAAADQLKYRDFLTIAVVINRQHVFPDNWIYIHDPTVKVGRMQNFKSWSPYMTPDDRTTCLGLEYFCFEGDGLWASSDEELVALAKRELAQLGMCTPEEVLWGVVVRQPKAYPVYDDTYKQHLAVIRAWIEATLPNLALVGRNGMHHYNNQDHSMMTALLAARNIATGSRFDPWKVNTDAEYHEEARFEDEDTSGRLVPTLVRAEK